MALDAERCFCVEADLNLYTAHSQSQPSSAPASSHYRPSPPPPPSPMVAQFRCQACWAAVGSVKALNAHVNTTAHKAHRCGHCPEAFVSEDKVTGVGYLLNQHDFSLLMSSNSIRTNNMGR